MEWGESEVEVLGGEDKAVSCRNGAPLAAMIGNLSTSTLPKKCTLNPSFRLCGAIHAEHCKSLH